MAAKKKTAVAENVEKVETVETAAKTEESDTAEKPVRLEGKNGRLTLGDVAEIVNAIVDSVFAERNGKIEFAAEYYEVLLAYFEIGAFYPETEVLENSVNLFFMDYIDGKYHRELEELKHSRLAQYIDNAVKKKVEAKMRQIENPLINSLTKFADNAVILSQKYVDDINNVATDDIKKFITDFAELAKKTNPQTVTDFVVERHKEEFAKESEKEKIVPKKRSTRAKKSDIKTGGAV